MPLIPFSLNVFVPQCLTQSRSQTYNTLETLHGEKLPDILHLLGESIIPVVLNKCSTAAPLGSVELAFTKASVVTE